MIAAVNRVLQPLHSTFDLSVEAAQNVYLNGPAHEVAAPIGFDTRIIDNAGARGGQTPRPPKSVQWMREWVRRLDRWKKNNQIEGEATVIRWWNENPRAVAEIEQADYTVEEFVEAIPLIQKVVDDKRAGVVVPVQTMSRADRIANLPRASAPALRTNQTGGTTMPKFEDPHFRSAHALIGEYARALAEQRSGTNTLTTSSSSSIPSSASRKGSSRVQLNSREQVQRWSDDRDDSSATASCSIPSYDPREGRSDEGAAIIKTLDPDLFIDYCERCVDYEDARIRWVDTTKDGENSLTRAVGQACAMANRRLQDPADYRIREVRWMLLSMRSTFSLL